MTRSRITYNKGSYRISISKKLVDNSGLQEDGSIKPIDVNLEVSKDGLITIRGLRFKKNPETNLKDLPIDRKLVEEYCDDSTDLPKRKTYKQAFVDLSHLPEEVANDPSLQNHKAVADFHSRKILAAHREYKRKTRKNVEILQKLHRDFRRHVDFLIEKKGKRPRTCDTNKP